MHTRQLDWRATVDRIQISHSWLTCSKQRCAVWKRFPWAWRRVRRTAVEIRSWQMTGVAQRVHCTPPLGHGGNVTRVTLSRCSAEGDKLTASSALAWSMDGMPLRLNSCTPLSVRILSPSLGSVSQNISGPVLFLGLAGLVMASLVNSGERFSSSSWGEGCVFSRDFKLSTFTQQSSSWSHNMSTRANSSRNSAIL